MIDTIIALIFVWGIGLAIDISLIARNKYCDGFELCNPYWAYKYCKKVNWFGACVVSLIFTVLCPPAAAIYWFYKLCTWGRR